jgi:hypothetical protein
MNLAVPDLVTPNVEPIGMDEGMINSDDEDMEEGIGAALNIGVQPNELGAERLANMANVPVDNDDLQLYHDVSIHPVTFFLGIT